MPLRPTVLLVGHEDADAQCPRIPNPHNIDILQIYVDPNHCNPINFKYKNLENTIER
jgi:hypothetical protein